MKGKIHRIVLTNGEVLLVEEETPGSGRVPAIHIATESDFENEAEAYICTISADGVLVMPNSCDAGAVLTCELKLPEQLPEPQKKPLLPELDSSAPIVSAFTAHNGYKYPDGAAIKYSPDAKAWRAWWKPEGNVQSLHRSDNNEVSYYQTAEDAAKAFQGTGQGPDCPEWNYWGRALSTAKSTK